MARTASTMLELGTKAPAFDLQDAVSGRRINLDTYSDKKALLVMFICNHCPFVKHVKNELARLGVDYGGRSVGIVAINSNDVDNFPDDSPEHMKKMAQQTGYTFPYCHDETQQVARAYQAACTPEFYLFDDKRKLVYRGQLDDSRPDSETPVTGKDLRAALDAVLAGKAVNPNQKASLGCNIKWKPGNEPKY